MKFELKHNLNECLTFVVKDIHGQMHYRKKDTVISGGTKFVPSMWKQFKHNQKSAGMQLTIVDGGTKRGGDGVRGDLEEWRKLYPAPTFTKEKTMNGRVHNITLDYLQFIYFESRKWLEFEALVVCD